jgi:DNA-binding transcriptional MerR regulator
VPGVNAAELSGRLLSIGEFAAATQLSPKALRLYDEQRLLQPARVDAASGYRYYRRDQVALGRLIRTLRDMELSLADVAHIVAAGGTRAEMLLSEFAKECDHRYTREKRAFQRALLLLRDAPRSDSLPIEEKTRPAMTVVVRPFMADRGHFCERLRAEIESAQSWLAQAGLPGSTESFCRLVDPLTDEEARLELLLKVEASLTCSDEITLRRLPAASCAVIATGSSSLQACDLSAPLDAIFDWFDRRGHRALDAPWLARVSPDSGWYMEIQWAYGPAPRATR